MDLERSLEQQDILCSDQGCYEIQNCNDKDIDIQQYWHWEARHKIPSINRGKQGHLYIYGKFKMRITQNLNSGSQDWRDISGKKIHESARF